MKQSANWRLVVDSRPVPTIIELVLDQTGSMSQHLSATIGGFNEFIAEQRQQDGLALLTLTKFSTTERITPFVDLDLNMVPDLTTKTFLPSGGTNLRDAIVNRITELKERLTHWDIQPKVLFVVMTDGEDNSSQHNVIETKRTILEASENGWVFAFLGAYIGSGSVACELGFPEGNIKSFAGTKMREAIAELSSATTVFRTSATNTGFFNQAS